MVQEENATDAAGKNAPKGKILGVTNPGVGSTSEIAIKPRESNVQGIFDFQGIIEILLVENNPSEAYMLQRMLREERNLHFNVTWAKNLTTALPYLESGGFAAALVDLKLPESTGLRTFDAVKKAGPSIPVVVLASPDEERAALGAMKQGAQDYFIKSYADSRLLARVVRYAIERHRMLAFLRESEQRSLTILNSVLIGIIIVDEETRAIVDMNAVAEEVIGLPRAEVVGQDAARFVGGDIARYEDVPQESKPTQIEKESVLYDAEGREVPIVQNVFAVDIFNRRHVVESFLDLRPRNEAQNALRETEVRYELLYNSVSDAIYACPIAADGTLGQVSEANDVLGQRLGYTRADLFHLTVADFVTATPGEVQAIAARLLSESRVLFEWAELTKNGRPIPVEVNAHSFDFNGQPSVLFITRDVTERKQREALDIQQSRVEERGHVIDEFIAKFSHELRNPLNIVIGFTDLLLSGQMGPLAPEQGDCLQDVHASGEYLLALINEILDIAKIESGVMEFPREWFTAGELVESLRTQVGQANQQKNHAIIIDVPQLDAAIYSCLLKVEQVLLNLLTNAVKFTPPRGHITLAITDAGGDATYFAVADDGPGIKDEDKPRIFQKFTRLQPEVDGTGLGLALSKQIVRQLGGDLQFESTFGTGSTFFFTLRN